MNLPTAKLKSLRRHKILGAGKIL